MPAQRLSMRQVREVLRLKWACGLSDRKIAQSLRISRPTVAEYVRRAQATGLAWPLPDALDDVALERRLFPTTAHTPTARRPIPDWARVHRSSNARVSPWSSCGKNTRPAPPMASSTAQFVRRIASGRASSIWSCGRATGRARHSLSTTPARRCRSSMPSQVKSAKRRSSSPSWGPPTIPLSKRPGGRVCPIGSGPMSAPLRRLVGCPRSWSRIISRLPSAGPIAMNLPSTAPMPNSRSTMEWPSSLPAPPVPG